MLARRRRLLIVLAAAVVAAIVVVGILQSTGSGSDDKPLSAQQVRAGIADATPVPAPLAALHAQSGKLLAGGQSAFDDRLKALRGTPVVVNVWGSWCGPCRAEFPLFQRASITFAKSVAFIGLDTEDAKGDALQFLRSEPVPYPSYQDLKGKIAGSLGLAATPTTIFYDRAGHTVPKSGNYTKLADLEHDIRTFALHSRA